MYQKELQYSNTTAVIGRSFVCQGLGVDHTHCTIERQSELDIVKYVGKHVAVARCFLWWYCGEGELERESGGEGRGKDRSRTTNELTTTKLHRPARAGSSGQKINGISPVIKQEEWY